MRAAANFHGWPLNIPEMGPPPRLKLEAKRFILFGLLKIGVYAVLCGVCALVVCGVSEVSQSESRAAERARRVVEPNSRAKTSKSEEHLATTMSQRNCFNRC
jgi:hypothetical protein